MSKKERVATLLSLGIIGGGAVGEGVAGFARRRQARGALVPPSKDVDEIAHAILRARSPEGTRFLSERDSLVRMWERKGKNARTKGEFISDVMNLNAERKLMGPKYDPLTKEIYNAGSAKPEFLAREVGKAQNHKLMGRAYHPATSVARKATEFGNYIAPIGMANYFATKDKNPELAKKWRNRTFALSAIPAGIVAADELSAHLRAGKMLKQMRRLDSQAKRNLVRSFGANAGHAMVVPALVGGIYAADYLRDKAKKRREKTAAVRRMIALHRSRRG